MGPFVQPKQSDEAPMALCRGFQRITQEFGKAWGKQSKSDTNADFP